MSDSNKPTNGKIDELVPGHDYDGIQEFNNPAPFWWQLFFYISIVFGIGYFAYYQFLGGPTLDQELAVRLEKFKSAQAATQGAGPDEAALAALVADASHGDSSHMTTGQKVFAERCVVCHLADGGGLVGPNLTDNYWIHDKGSLVGIYNVIKNGVGDKGMPPWGPILSEDEIRSVTVYVRSLKGKPVAAAKDPQGELVAE